MPKLVVLSFNMQGVPGSVIADGIMSIKPDIAAFQEAPSGTSQFYTDVSSELKKKNVTNYGQLGPIREYPSPPPLIGGFGLDAQGNMKQVLVYYNTDTLNVTKNLRLVDLLKDSETPEPKDVFEARDLGFASRTPAYCRFAHKSANPQNPPNIGLFVWHAPTKVDLAHKQALKYFGESDALSKACSKNNLTILAGDFNNDLLPSSYKKFDEGIQHKYDWILADKATAHNDLLFSFSKTLNDMHTTSQDHFAMAVEFTY